MRPRVYPPANVFVRSELAGLLSVPLEGTVLKVMDSRGDAEAGAASATARANADREMVLVRMAQLLAAGVGLDVRVGCRRRRPMAAMAPNATRTTRPGVGVTVSEPPAYRSDRSQNRPPASTGRWIESKVPLIPSRPGSKT